MEAHNSDLTVEGKRLGSSKIDTSMLLRKLSFPHKESLSSADSLSSSCDQRKFEEPKEMRCSTGFKLEIGELKSHQQFVHYLANEMSKARAWYMDKLIQLKVSRPESHLS